MRPWLFISMTALLVLASSPAGATPNFPAALAGDLGLSSPPDCSLCHTDGDQGGTGTVNTPFGKNMRARGLVAYDTGSLTAALALMESENVDSAGGCLSDVDELKAGRSPNDPGDQADCDGGAAMTTTSDSVELPTYGCSVARATPSPGEERRAWLSALAGLAMLLTWRRVRRAHPSR
jgi:MYXO-CTERM domain-containing protein